MNILFFAGRIIYGGGEKVRNWLAKMLAQNGHAVYYAVDFDIEKARDQLQTVGLMEWVKIVPYDSSLKKKAPVRYLRQIRQIYKDNHINLLIYFGGSLFEQVVARDCGVKILLSERFYNGFRPLPSRLLKQVQYRISDGYVFQTPEASRVYGRKANRMGTVIPNPIIDKLPEPQFNNLRKEIVSVGRLSEQKDHKSLIMAFCEFHKLHPEYQLIIYGSGPLYGDLVEYLRSLGVEDYVKIVGGKLNIVEKERGAELFVLSSLAEGMPNALIEAMSVGMLCISTDCPIYGPRMLVQHGENGYLVPMKSPHLLATMMEEALKDKEKADAIRHNALRIRETLEQDKIARMWVDYINKVVSAKDH